MNKEPLSAPVESGPFRANPGISGPSADEKPKLTPSQQRVLGTSHSSRPVADRRRACPRQGSRDCHAKRSQFLRRPVDSWACKRIRPSPHSFSDRKTKRTQFVPAKIHPRSSAFLCSSNCLGVLTAAHRTRLAVSTKMTKRTQSRPIPLGSTPCSRIHASRSPLDERKTERSQFRRRPLPSLLRTRIGFRPGSGAPLRAGSVGLRADVPSRPPASAWVPTLANPRRLKRTQSRAQWAAAKTNPICPKPAGLTRWTDPHPDSRHAGERVRRSKPVVTGHETHQMRNNLHPQPRPRATQSFSPPIYLAGLEDGVTMESPGNLTRGTWPWRNPPR